MSASCPICGGTGRVEHEDELVPTVTVGGPCPRGCWDAVMADWLADKRARGWSAERILGLVPTGGSLLHPTQRDRDGGPRVVDP